jgi:thiamine-phosphate pyrophosphorylase
VTLPRLYAVIDADVAAAHGWTVTDLARACLEGGATFLQLRAKDRPLQWTVDAADAILAMAGPSVTIIVNDRADVAKLAGANGVHVGQDDLSPAEARIVVGPESVIGLSTHTPAQVDRALAEPIDYLAVGPVYDTATKATGYRSVGHELLRYAAVRARDARRTEGRTGAPLPVVAIGGITLERAPGVIASGASSVAVISDLVVGGNPSGRVKTFVERLAAAEAAL